METLASRMRQARKRAGLSQGELARRIGVGQSTIASVENGRNQASRFLVPIAEVLGVNPFWLANGGDTPVEMPEAGPAKLQLSEPAMVYVTTKIVTIPRYDTGGSMGHGVVLQDQPGVIEALQVSPEWLRANVRGYTSAENLAIVTGFGDSMRPTYNPGDPLIVDRGVTTVPYDSIYFFRIRDEGFVKRLQRVPTDGGLIYRAISDNPAYPPFDVGPNMDFEVLARVVQVWRREDY